MRDILCYFFNLKAGLHGFFQKESRRRRVIQADCEMGEKEEEYFEEMPTETLARLYVRQGFPEKGLSIYRKLRLMDPANRELEKTLEDLERQLTGGTGQGGGKTDERALKTLENWLSAIQDKKGRLKMKESEQNRVLVIHGPNLNMLGKREKDIYGTATLDQINAELVAAGEEMGLSVETFQSNHEGDIVDRIQAALEGCRGIIINPAAYTHTSIAIRDALLLLDIPVIEVHLSNIYKREPFRHKSMTSAVVTAQIAGLGKQGYLVALRAIAELIK